MTQNSWPQIYVQNWPFAVVRVGEKFPQWRPSRCDRGQFLDGPPRHRPTVGSPEARTDIMPCQPSYLTSSRTASKEDFHVPTRRGSAVWADSVLPPSPRMAMANEVGHVTTKARRPSLGQKTAVGVKPPPAFVQSSDRALDAEGWMSDRVPPQQQPGAAMDERAMAAKQAAREYQYRARMMLLHQNLQREQGWDNSTLKQCPANLRGIKPITVEPWYDDAGNFSAPTAAEVAAQKAGAGAHGAPASPMKSSAAPRRSAFSAATTQAEAAAEESGCSDTYRSPTKVPHGGAHASAAGRAPGVGSIPASSARRKFVEKSVGARPASGYRGGASSARASPASRAGAASPGRGGWDSTPFRPTPHALRGVKPVTREPWMLDQAMVPIYRKLVPDSSEGVGNAPSALNTARCSVSSGGSTVTLDASSSDGEGGMGSVQDSDSRSRSSGRSTPKARKPAWQGVPGEVSRAFRMPAWEKWAASLYK